MTRRISSALALMLAALLAACCACADAEESASPAPTADITAESTPGATAEPTPTAAPAESAAVEDGTVRVLLTYPGVNLTELDITLEGSYSVNGNAGFRFERGSRLHVFVSEGEPVLTYEGMTLHMGAGFALTRHNAAGTNALRIGGVAGLYEGDLSVTVVDGALRLVLSIYVEDYLKGVVPYEMSDSFPQEALKAQAVAARTYVLKRRNPAREWDVYDNTSDQVFRGYEAQYVNAARAVEETRGMVGTYRGELAECFYSASNGGQTDLYANVFADGADYGYLDMRADPYDLANPQSRLKTAGVPKQPGSLAPLPEGLDALLKAALGEQLAALGYDDSPENITIIDISYVAPHTPMYAVPSRVFTQLRFKLRAMACAVTPDAGGGLALSAQRVLSDELTVDLPIFGSEGVEQALGLSINRLDNELITVSDAGDRFIIEARRFGHGLGMSQRGAEYMAGTYGWTYEEILAFYYPGMEFTMRRYAPAILPAIAEEQAATPRPTAEPTPRPTLIPVGELPEGAFYAEVALASDDSTLNLRAEPNTTAQILCALMNRQPVIVLRELGDGWVQVQVGSLTGYVAAQYLRLI